MGCNTYVYGNNTRNLPVYLSSSQTSEMPHFLIIFYVFSSTKLENKRVEQVLPRGMVGGRRRGMAQIMYTHVSKWKK
jgi:hypothetical protein